MLRKKPKWSVKDALRSAFYNIEANADPNRAKELLQQSLAVNMACLWKIEGGSSDRLWEMFGLVEGSPEAEVIKLKEFASAMLQETQQQQEKFENELKTLKDALKESQDACQIEKESNAKLSAALQTALTTAPVAAPAPPAPTVTPAPVLASSDTTEIDGLRKQLAAVTANLNKLREAQGLKFDDDTKAVIKLLAEKMPETPDADEARRWLSVVSGIVEGDISNAVENLNMAWPSKAETVEVKLALYFLQNSVAGA